MASLRASALGLLTAAVLLVVVALRAPFAAAVFGIVLLGPLHVLLAVRYLSGRIAGAVPARTGWLLLAFLAAMALVRAVATFLPQLGHQLELAGSLAVVGAALTLGLRGRLRLLALAPAALLAALPLIPLPWYAHLVAHGHNLIPLVFLWDWTRGRPARHRLGFVAANLVWLLGVPALLLGGVADPVLNPRPPEAVTRLVDPAVVVAGAAPPGADAALGLRFLAVFAFLQAMHYVLWLVFFPLRGRAEARRSPLPAGRRLWLLAALLTGVIWAAYAVSYYDGRAAYSVLGAFNAYLEQPVAVWLLLTALPASATSPLIGRLRFAGPDRQPLTAAAMTGQP